MEVNIAIKYSENLRKIYTWSMFRNLSKDAPVRKLNLNNMKNLSEHFGNPHLAFETFHIAGTNGKGSVSLKTATGL
jgi:folylpolyglutamate synthase/dihydropteroate synthase